MVQDTWPVLLTATISPSPLPHLVLTDPRERWRQYQQALQFWLNRPAVRQIIFCDNSGYDADYQDVKTWARKRGKVLEVISYKGNDASGLRGRAYGEGELIKRVLKTSILMRQAPGFFKVTGRFVVENFDSLERLTRKQRIVMSRRSVRKTRWADTRFFKMERSFYCGQLMEVHQLAQDDEWILGEAYASILAPLGIPSFPRALRIRGIAGNGAVYGDKLWRYLVKSVMAQAGLYRV